ncbi:hypothetical protein E1A91_D08G127700v1 [Gossypium mustelinum]|uniref:Uncharacterized protein n=1 Tax=Gossypium mustelinum TaxID=34275 RepID=A0A5D2TWU9_GOSMU|nr:hypothetical protein E1A91_D08G127700v1 [Gossypium mustelinum]
MLYKCRMMIDGEIFTSSKIISFDRTETLLTLSETSNLPTSLTDSSFTLFKLAISSSDPCPFSLLLL